MVTLPRDTDPTVPDRTAAGQGEGESPNDTGHSGITDRESLNCVNTEFNYDELREVLGRFTNQFDTRVARDRENLLRQRNTYRARVSELMDNIRARQRDIERVHQSLRHRDAQRDAQAADKASLLNSIEELGRQRDLTIARTDELKSLVSSVQDDINAVKRAHAEYALYAEQQAKLNLPELHFWQAFLGLHVDHDLQSNNETFALAPHSHRPPSTSPPAKRTKRLRFTFTSLPLSDENAHVDHATFTLDVTHSQAYTIVACYPLLDDSLTQRYIREYNTSSNFLQLLKQMRLSFQQTLSTALNNSTPAVHAKPA